MSKYHSSKHSPNQCHIHCHLRLVCQNVLQTQPKSNSTGDHQLTTRKTRLTHSLTHSQTHLSTPSHRHTHSLPYSLTQRTFAMTRIRNIWHVKVSLYRDTIIICTCPLNICLWLYQVKLVMTCHNVAYRTSVCQCIKHSNHTLVNADIQ